jgi:hypothetical protein
MPTYVCNITQRDCIGALVAWSCVIAVEETGAKGRPPGYRVVAFIFKKKKWYAFAGFVGLFAINRK